MKLSRRGKLGRRVRHTKRAGKHLRYKCKKVHASKRYHRGHKRTHKCGRRFQRGGAPGDKNDTSSISSLESTPPAQQLLERTRPEDLAGHKKIETPLEFEYKRTDGRHGLFTEPGTFDVFLTFDRGLNQIELLRHSKKNFSYDKRISIHFNDGNNILSTEDGLKDHLTGIQGYNMNNSPEGIYTFPKSDTNKKSFKIIDAQLGVVRS